MSKLDVVIEFLAHEKKYLFKLRKHIFPKNVLADIIDPYNICLCSTTLYIGEKCCRGEKNVDQTRTKNHTKCLLELLF